MLRRVVSILVLVLASTLYAQDSKFTASAPATVQEGRKFQYVIQGDEQGDVKLPDLEKGLEFAGGPSVGYQTRTSLINGKMQASTIASYTYLILATKAGEFTIPPATIKTRKDSYKTNEVSVTVIKDGQSSSTGITNATQISSSGNKSSSSTIPGEDSRLFLKIIPSKKSMYVGEQFVSELKIYTSVNTGPAAGIKEIPYEGFYKKTLEADNLSSRENLNGTTYLTQVLQRHILIPQKSGKITIPAYESEWTIPQRVSGGRGRTGDPFEDFFNDPFFDRVQNVPTTIRTKPIVLNVKPLPDGAPESFNGAVGDFIMTANLSADKVKVNDAISLIIEITGTGNLTLIGAPEVNFPPDHDVYETTTKLKDRTTGNRISGTITFEYPVVARHAGSFRIAPVKFSYFDPSTGEYKTMISEEFAFVVEKGEKDDDQAQIFMPGARQEVVENIGTDILDIHRAVPQFTRSGKSPLSTAVYWIAFLLILISFIASVFILNTWMKQRADIQLIRNRKANKMAKTRLKSADKARKAQNSELFFEETEKALWGYLSDKLSIELSSLSRDKVSEVLNGSGIEQSLQDELIRIIDECEFSRYAPSSDKSDMDVLYKNAISLINNLEHNIRVK